MTRSVLLSLSAISPEGQALHVSGAGESEAQVIVYVDFKSPYAYLAIEPTRDMLKRLKLVADWRPFVLDIGSYLGTAKLAKDGKVEKQNRSQEQWSGVKYAYYDCRRYANLAGQTIRGTVKIWDTNLPAIGMWWIKLHEDLAAQNAPTGLLQQYLDAVYRPFWRREFDAEEVDAILAALAQIGAPTEGFRSFALDQGQGFNDAAQQRIFDDGVYGVPTYILPGHTEATGDSAKFFGREHLPRIEWMLSDGIGDAPDVAYELAADVDLQSLERSAAEPGVTKGEMCLPVFFDFKSPNSYLALPRLLALKASGVELVWHPFRHKPLKPPASEMPNEDRSIRHRRIRGEYIAADIQRYAPHRLQDVYLATDCSLANLGLLWLADREPCAVDNYVSGIFVALWRDGLDITTAAVVERVMDQVSSGFKDGIRTWRAYCDEEGALSLEQAYAHAASRGVSYAPTFYLGDEPFQGRAQLPLILARLRAGV